MTTDPVNVTCETSAAEVARLMQESGLDGLPVVDQEGRLLGLVTETDLLRLALPDYLEEIADLSFLPEDFEPFEHAFERVSDVPVRDFMMARELPVAEERDHIAEIARLMCKFGVRRVPVVRDGRLVGMINRSDVVREIVHPRLIGP